MGDAQAAQAADQVGHRLGAEAENSGDEHESRVKRWISEAFHEFAKRAQGIDPAQEEAARRAGAGGGLQVQKTGPDPTAGQGATTTGEAGTAAGSTPGQPGGE